MTPRNPNETQASRAFSEAQMVPADVGGLATPQNDHPTGMESLFWLVGRPLQKFPPTLSKQTHHLSMFHFRNSHLDIDLMSKNQLQGTIPSLKKNTCFNTPFVPIETTTNWTIGPWSSPSDIKMRNTEIQGIGSAIRCSPVDAWEQKRNGESSWKFPGKYAEN